MKLLAAGRLELTKWTKRPLCVVDLRGESTGLGDVAFRDEGSATRKHQHRPRCELGRCWCLGAIAYQLVSLTPRKQCSTSQSEQRHGGERGVERFSARYG